MKLNAQNEQVVRSFPVPPQLAPGYVQAVEIRVTHAAMDEVRPPKTGVVWIAAPATNDGPKWVRFHVVLEPVGARQDTWPGRNGGSGFVGRVPVSDGRSVCVVTTITPAADVTVRMTQEERDQLMASVRHGTDQGDAIGAVAWGLSPEVGVWLIIGRAEVLD